MKPLRLALPILSTFLATPVFAAAFQLYELGTPVIGTAGVGQAAIAMDASTAYFNPAGMTQLSATQFLLGSEIIIPDVHFKKNNDNTTTGNNGGNASPLTPGVGMYFVYSATPSIKLGASLTSPYDGFLTYNDGWAGRYMVQNTQLLTMNLNPSAAYKINQWLSIGVGAAIEYAGLYQTVALPYQPNNDGQITVKVHDYSPGYNAGLLLTPYQQTKIGIAYRSRILHTMHGNLTFLRIPETPSVTTAITMPQNVIVSLAQVIGQRFTLLGEAGWSNWATMDKNVLNVDGVNATTILDWRNTYRLGLGGQYNLNSVIKLQAGASYDSSPTDSEKRTPNLPMDRQVRVGTGAIFMLNRFAQLAVSYEYINFGNAEINNGSAYGGVLAGSYAENYANVVQASINITC